MEGEVVEEEEEEDEEEEEEWVSALFTKPEAVWSRLVHSTRDVEVTAVGARESSTEAAHWSGGAEHFKRRAPL